MENIKQDLINEHDIENFIPKSHVSTTAVVLFLVAVMIFGVFIALSLIPNPEILRGKVVIVSPNQAIIYVVAKGTGEIKNDMNVKIYLDNYDKKKYGFLSGKIVGFTNKGNPDDNGFYNIVVILPYGLRTNLGIMLNKDIYLQGKGEILIQEHSFLESIIENIN